MPSPVVLLVLHVAMIVWLIQARSQPEPDFSLSTGVPDSMSPIKHRSMDLMRIDSLPARIIKRHFAAVNIVCCARMVQSPSGEADAVTALQQASIP